MAFSTPIALPRPLAGWWTRGGALAIDLVITAGIELALLLIAWAITGSSRLTVAHAETLLFEIGLPVVILYAPLLLARGGDHNGQTIGKQAMRIRVIRGNGLPMTFATAVVRETLGRQLPSLLTYGLYLPFDYLWPLRDPQRQALHDKVGRTFVVAAGGPEPAPDRPAPDATAWGSADFEESGLPSQDETVRGAWLPPIAPSPRDGE